MVCSVNLQAWQVKPKGLQFPQIKLLPVFFTLALSGLTDKKKKRKQIHTKSSYIKVGKIMGYNGIKQLSVIHMDDISIAFTSVFLAG